MINFWLTASGWVRVLLTNGKTAAFPGIPLIALQLKEKRESPRLYSRVENE
jgi:hypothetical protein